MIYNVKTGYSMSGSFFSKVTDIVDNDMEGKEAVKLSIPILQNIEDDKWENKLWDDRQDKWK